MDRVFVFTSLFPWSQMDSSVLKPEWLAAYPKPGGNKLVRCLFESGQPATLQAVGDCNQEGVYLVYDEIDLDFLKTIKSQGEDGGNLYVLYHTRTPKDRLNIIRSGNCISRDGMHTNDPEKLYYLLFKILVARDDEKLDRVVQLFKSDVSDLLKDAVERFVLYSAKPAFYRDKLKSTYDELCAYARVKKQVKDFYELIDPDKKNVELKDYPRQFAKMKETLLRAVGLV